MSRSMDSAKCAAAACLVLLAFPTSALAASGYTISWSGTIAPSGVSDPWGLGASPTEFVVAVDVPFDAADYSSGDVPNASFDLTSSRLWIGGQPASFVGPAGITFTDGGVGAMGILIPDLLFFGGEFSLNGEVAGFASFFGIDRSSFTFTQNVELPPPFTSTSVVTAPGTALGSGVYTVSVPMGALVTVVPEPSGVWMAIGLFSSFARRRR